MKTSRILPLVAVGAFAADCGVEPPPGETSETDTFCFDCELIIAYVNAECDDGGTPSTADHAPPNDDTVTFTVHTDAWAGGVEVALVDTGDDSPNRWTESHLFPESANVNFCADGSCDEWVHTLAEVGTTAEVDDDHTFLNCAWYELNDVGTLRGLAIKATVYDDSTPANEADCVIWGYLSGDSEFFGGDGCACAEAWLDPAPGDPCGDNN